MHGVGSWSMLDVSACVITPPSPRSKDHLDVYSPELIFARGPLLPCVLAFGRQTFHPPPFTSALKAACLRWQFPGDAREPIAKATL